MFPKKSVEKFANLLIEISSDSPFTVFLCGPTLDTDNPGAAAMLRKRIIELLEENNFEVVLGEDEGLEDVRLEVGFNAQDSELLFIKEHCNAVVIVADSVGSFCELGLFSWHFIHTEGLINRDTTISFIVLVQEQFSPNNIAPKKSYFNEGPMNSLLAFGKPLYVNFDSYDADEVLKILMSARTIQTVERRGRPRSRK